MNNNYAMQAEVRLPTTDLRGDLGFFTRMLGMRLDSIYPANDPKVAVFAGHGVTVRLDQTMISAAGVLRILTDDTEFASGARGLTAPGGTIVEIAQRDHDIVMPPTKHAFEINCLRDQKPWVKTYCGLETRELIPGRLGGAITASHMRFEAGGPIADTVHYHKTGFQMVYCYKGWVDVVYEDQGEQIRLMAGDCCLQPPEIRHRVVAASEGMELIEVAAPADHVTRFDHDMTLPNLRINASRKWRDQPFIHHVAKTAVWGAARLPGFTARDTAFDTNTKGMAGAQVLRRTEGAPVWATHDADIHFSVVLSGTMTLEGEGYPPRRLEPGDAFAIPPGLATRYDAPSDQLALLEVSLPGLFATSANS